MPERRYRVLYRQKDGKTDWSRLQTLAEAEGLMALNTAVEIVEVKKQKFLPSSKQEGLLDRLFGDLFKEKK